MATVTPDRSSLAKFASSAPQNVGYSPDQWHEMLHDDLRAGVSVSAVLTAIIVTGVVIGFTGVLMSIFWLT